jgi:hypothetical protein
MDVLTIEQAQVGYRPKSNGDTKYGLWLDQVADTHVYHDADWCGSSQLWSIAQLGEEYSAAAGGVDKDFAYVQNWLDWFQAKGRLSHTPKARRLVWYDWAGTPDGANHIGLVKSVSGRSMVVYEGNHAREFDEVTRTIDSQVMGFGEWWSFVEHPANVADEVLYDMYGLTR